ncbi:type 2 lantipeptide synthetase LanM [Enterobacter hormaechei]|nr:type 2 lantipeptide synthetase LanM [Enterobacter hormaechei]
MIGVYFNGDVFSPIYNHLVSDFAGDILKLSSRTLPVETLNDFISHSYYPILRKCWERVLMLELNFAEKNNLLTGSTQNERFEFYVKEIIKKENIELIYKKYPLFEKQWNDEIRQYTDGLKKTLVTITNDITEAANYFYGDLTTLVVTKIRPVGDPHKGMKMSTKVTYENEKNQQRILYYKPRNLSLDKGFERFINWWNNNAKIKHKVPRVMLKDGYGWCESISQQKCNDHFKVKSYYLAYGSLVAFSHIFATTDLHMENIISHGEYPVVIDIETLFSCLFEFERNHPVKYHIYSSLLLPSHADNNIELSPLTFKENVQTDINVFVNPQKKVTSMKMEKKKFNTIKNKNQVKLNNYIVNFLDYKNEIIEGFEDTMLFILNNKDLFLDKIIECMSSCLVRILTRSTFEYSKILHNVYHPSSLYYKEKNRDINVLSNDFYDADILNSEIDELLSGDIPYFEMKFDGKTLMNGRGDSLSTKVILSPLLKVKKQLKNLSLKSIEQTKMDVAFTFIAYQLRVM